MGTVTGPDIAHGFALLLYYCYCIFVFLHVLYFSPRPKVSCQVWYNNIVTIPITCLLKDNVRL